MAQKDREHGMVRTHRAENTEWYGFVERGRLRKNEEDCDDYGSRKARFCQYAGCLVYEKNPGNGRGNQPLYFQERGRMDAGFKL